MTQREVIKQLKTKHQHESSFETCKTAASAAMSKPSPGNINGIGMWIKGSEIQTAIDFFAWFRTTYPS